jgi:hypothetical protein
VVREIPGAFSALEFDERTFAVAKEFEIRALVVIRTRDVLDRDSKFVRD